MYTAATQHLPLLGWIYLSIICILTIVIENYLPLLGAQKLSWRIVTNITIRKDAAVRVAIIIRKNTVLDSTAVKDRWLRESKSYTAAVVYPWLPKYTAIVSEIPFTLTRGCMMCMCNGSIIQPTKRSISAALFHTISRPERSRFIY